MRVAGWRASPGTPGTGRCGLPVIFCRQRSIHRWSEGGSSNGSRCPRSFRPAGCIEPRNGIGAKSLSCLFVAGPLPSDLFLSAKYLRFAANEAVRSARILKARGQSKSSSSVPEPYRRDQSWRQRPNFWRRSTSPARGEQRLSCQEQRVAIRSSVDLMIEGCKWVS